MHRLLDHSGPGTRVEIIKSPAQRRLHKALLRYHDPRNWPLIRQALSDLKLQHLIGTGEKHLVPAEQPRDAGYTAPRRKNSQEANEKRRKKGKQGGQLLTQHTGLPPRKHS